MSDKQLLHTYLVLIACGFFRIHDGKCEMAVMLDGCPRCTEVPV